LVQRQLANIRLELREKTTRGKNPRPLEPNEIRSRELRRDNLMTQLSRHVNRHTTVEADRTIAAINDQAGVVVESVESVKRSVESVKRTFKESFCPEVREGASAKERLDAIKARQSVERGLMVQLRKESVRNRSRGGSR